MSPGTPSKHLMYTIRLFTIHSDLYEFNCVVTIFFLFWLHIQNVNHSSLWSNGLHRLAEICIPSVCDPSFPHFQLRHQRFETLPGSVDAKLSVGCSAVPSYELTAVQMSGVQSGHTIKYREIIQILAGDVVWILRL